MIKITQLKLPIEHKKEDLERKVCKLLQIPPSKLYGIEILKRSLDARKTPLMYNYQLGVFADGEEKIVKKIKNKDVSLGNLVKYRFPNMGEDALNEPPVIIGAGPAGLFCAYMLAKAGFRPILLERGEGVEERQKKVDHFWATGELDTQSNVQFGEGGAGTFSDGKLNTLVKDNHGRSRFVLKTFVEFGAKDDILYESKPHIGTDILIDVVRNMRNEIIKLGGDIRFNSQVTDFKIENNEIIAVQVNHKQWIETKTVVLAIGHSARDTFEMLLERKVPMRSKAFAVGVRMEHPQSLINENQYGKNYPDSLPAAAYKLTRKVADERGVYSFCMCPGGFVVPSSSSPDEIVVNGMSSAERNSKWSNAAIVVEIRPEDIPNEFVNQAEKNNHKELAGLYYRTYLEKLAKQNGQNQAAPCQKLCDFLNGKLSDELPSTSYTAGVVSSRLDEWIPEHISSRLKQGFINFDKNMKGFISEDALLIAMETRTSTPVRILRDKETFECEGIKNLYPAGEGSGYSGGIVSSAMDGENACEKIIERLL